MSWMTQRVISARTYLAAFLEVGSHDFSNIGIQLSSSQKHLQHLRLSGQLPQSRGVRSSTFRLNLSPSCD